MSPSAAAAAAAAETFAVSGAGGGYLLVARRRRVRGLAGFHGLRDGGGGGVRQLAGGFVRRWSSDYTLPLGLRTAFVSSIRAASKLGSPLTETDSVPMPIVLIDQDSDSDATIVQVSFGDRLGALMDTMQALKDIGLDVTKGTVTNEGSVIKTKFFIMRRGRKVEDPALLENIRLTIINDLLKYHPESSERLAMGEFFGVKPPEKLDVDITTQVFLRDDGPTRSLLYIESADRAGLLLDIVKIITYINIDVDSAEIDTEGLVAKDTFHVSYKGAALDSSLSLLLTNCLRFYLRRPETEEDSY